ncbi:hypothetical protein Pint_16414 [Pistacia integerrima]|uniref:Uncharacterized protein n=1 Tax=Pistacia integerrima TaxID=434235 RepID=A0ACC0ZCD9_9ROSI|nr:hypothetical protein Pint_16414 [Pistacia integerrima]
MILLRLAFISYIWTLNYLRYGDSKQCLVSRRRSQNIASGSLKDFKILTILQEKVLCRVCFEADISVVLLPCRHHILCSTCCDKCKKCPICRVTIEERLPVYDV